MTKPDLINLADDVVTLLTNEWNNGSGAPDNTVIAKSDDIGKGRDLSVYDYVEVSTTSPWGKEWHDIMMHSQNYDAALFVEIKASTETRRNELWSEFERIIDNNASRPDCPGDFDKVDWDNITPLDDETFGAYLMEITLGFTAKARA